jgi:hypothetical protein
MTAGFVVIRGLPRQLFWTTELCEFASRLAAVHNAAANIG